MKRIKRGIAFCLVIMLLMGIAFDNGFAMMDQVKAADETTEESAIEEQSITEEALAEETAATEETTEEPAVQETVPEQPEATPAAEEPATEETAAEETVPEQPETKWQQALQLKHEIQDAGGHTEMIVFADIKEGTFDANADEVTMKVSKVDAGLTETITRLAKDKLTEEQMLGSYFLYKVEFQVNGITVEPGREVKLTFQPRDYKVDDVKKANVFYYNEAYSPAGNQAEEIVEIPQKADKMEELQNAGASIENIDEEYDLTEITLHSDGKANEIVTEGRRSTVYGCYLEEQKPIENKEEVKEETTEATETEGTKTEEKENLKTLTYKNKEVTINVSEVKEGAIPKNAELKVVPIKKDDKDTKEQYAEVEKQVQKKAEKNLQRVKGFLAYDISFVDKEGKEIEPNSEVKVSIEYDEAAKPEIRSLLKKDESEVSILHLEEDEEGNIKNVVDMEESNQIDTLKKTSDNEIKKVELRTKSFSAFTIYWYEGNYSRDSVQVKYIDEEGNSLDAQASQANVNEYGLDQPITIADKYAKEIVGYTYKKSTVASSSQTALSATEILKLRLHKSWTWSGGSTYEIQYSYKDYFGYESWSGFESGEDIYMVYEKDSSGGGNTGGSSATGNLAHRKYVETKNDGTFDLTLDVTGAIGTENNPAKVDVVFVLDLSGSMKGTNIEAAKNAVQTLTTNVSKNKLLDSKWKMVTFSSRATTQTQEWISAGEINQKVQGYTDYSCNGGTNYEAGLRHAGAAIGTARADAVKIVIFLTDGEPTYHGVSTAGGSNKTNKADYEGALEGAKTITCNRFYAIGMGLPDKVYQPSWFEPWLSGLEVLTNVANQTTSDSKQAINVGEGESLDSVFAEISGSITTYTAENVTIVDTLTDEVDLVDPSQLVVRVLDKNKHDVTNQEKSAGNIQATYNQRTKQVKLDFDDSYALKDGYTYSVTVNIKTNAVAIDKYEKNDYDYPDTGEADTGVTSAGKKGIYSNKADSAKVTWSTNNENKEGTYNRPVVQIPAKDLPQRVKKEPVNFFLNLSSAILDVDGNIGGQQASAFTTSVSGHFSSMTNNVQGIGVPINEDLRVVVPQEHDHNQQTSSGVYGVIGGTSNINAKQVDEKIRELGHENGTNGNQSGTEDEYYQIVNGKGEAAFPTDEEIFSYIKTNWNTPKTGVNKNQNITVNGSPINKDKLTTENFAIRWYVFKDQANGEYWHIDGILVPKSGILTVKKTFLNEESALEVADSFKIQVTGDFLGDSESTTIEKSINDSEEPVKNSDGSLTFTWNLAVFGPQYTVKEIGYETDSGDRWEYESTEWKYTNASNQSETGNTTATTVGTERTAEDENAKTQTLEFTNKYSSKNEDLLPYILVSKTFTGLSSKQISQLASRFSLVVEKKDESFKKTLRLDDENAIVTPKFELNDDIKDYTYTWKIEGCKTGEYRVTETGQDVEDYDVTTEGVGETVEVKEGNWTFNPNVKTITSNKETNFVMGNNKIILASLTGSDGYLIWTNEQLSYTQRGTVINAINTLEELQTFKAGEATEENCHFYYGDALIDGISIAGGTIKYNSQTQKLSFSGKSQWKHVGEGTYSIKGAQNADIVVTNSYQEQNVEIDLLKHGTTYDNVLEGAKFTLYKGSMLDGKINWESNPVSGYEKFDISSSKVELNLSAGYYKLKETEAPVGYHVLDDEIAFKVEKRNVSLINQITGGTLESESEMWKLDNTGGKIVLHIKNDMIYELPQSGGTGIYWYLFGGMLLMMAASLVVYKKRRREVLERK